MKKLKLYPFIFLSMSFSILMSMTRYYMSGRMTYVFLFWNLILAFVPYVISECLLHIDLKNKKLIFIMLSFLWLLFFPNSPYIMTDLFHLKPKTGAPFWYDLMLLLSYSFNGFFLGFLSLLSMENMVSNYFSRRISHIFTFLSLIACSIGVYVGRYLRWNSWEVFTKPFSLLQELQDQDFYPIQDSDMMKFMIVFSTFLVVNYLILKKIMEFRDH